MSLRKFLYPLVLKKFGSQVSIKSNVQLIGPDLIGIEKHVKISRNVILEARENCSFAVGEKSILSENTYLRGGYCGRISLKEEVRLDYGVYIRSEKEGDIEIGERTYVGPYTCIGGPGPVKIGRDCMIGSHTCVYGNNHNFGDLARRINEQGTTSRGIVIEDNCWLGAGVKVLDGVTIGEGSVIGAGAVVTSDIPAQTVAVGVPARVISKRCSQVPIEESKPRLVEN
ncbi:acyltransferase [Acaryochloris thomasi]|nr:acyltransferase [Acaryochloris thomasi]